jgi:hypothetical protein
MIMFQTVVTRNFPLGSPEKNYSLVYEEKIYGMNSYSFFASAVAVNDSLSGLVPTTYLTHTMEPK